MTAALKIGDRAVFRAREIDNRRDGQTVTVTGRSDRGYLGRTPVVWPDGTRTSALTECLTLVEPPKPERPVVDEGDLRASAVALGIASETVEQLLTVTAVVTTARAS